MNLTVTNLSNDLAKNNAVYISPTLAKDPTRTVNVRISGKIMKCGFLQDLERGSVAMSRNIREFVGTEVGKTIRVEPVGAEMEEEAGLSFLELELNQVTPKLASKTKVEDYPLIEQLRTREKGSFFNMGEVKYLPVEGVVYSLKVVKCFALLNGENDQRR